MSQDTASVSFDCKKCGTRLAWPDDATDSTELACSNCGEYFGTYADLREAALDAVKSHMEGLIKDAFKGL